MASANSEDMVPVQEEMFRTLLRTPHRRVDEIVSIHKQQYDRDPNFYGKLAAYAAYQGNCAIRDVNEVFIAALFASEFPEHREAAYVMLQSLPPYQVARVMRTVTGYDEIVHQRSIDDPIPDGKFGIKVEKAKYSKRHQDKDKRGKVIPTKTHKLSKDEYRKLLEKGKIRHGQRDYKVDTLYVNHKCFEKRTVTGQLRKAIRDYLLYREQPENQAMLEGALIRMRKYMKQLYARTNTLPQGDESGWVNQYLFHGDASGNERLTGLKKFFSSDDPTEQAQAIVDYKIPFPVIVSAASNLTPSMFVAIITVMTPQELLSNMGMLTSRGATKHPEIKKLIEEKLKKAKKAKKARVDALKGAFAAKSVEGLDDDLAEIMTDVTNEQLKQHGKITARTALLIDKSGSMSQAIELGKELGAAIAQASESSDRLRVWMFDNIPTEIQWAGDITKKSSWDKKLAMFRASGGTDPSSVIRAMITNKIVVDQILVITDEGENTRGKFARQLIEYEKEMGVLPPVVIVRVGKEDRGWGVSDRMEKSCKEKGIEVDVLRCEDIDKIAIPNLLQLLSRKSVFELIQDILALPLPTKEEFRTRLEQKAKDKSKKSKVGVSA